MYREHAPDGPHVFYYLTLYNEPIAQLAEPDGVDVGGILAGMHRISAAQAGTGPGAQILASGIAVPWALEAQATLSDDWDVHADVWSVTSWTKLRRQALSVEDWNHLHPDEPRLVPYVTARLRGQPGPVVAVSDAVQAVPDQIAPFVDADWSSLGTYGFGLSDTRTASRRYLRVDAASIVVRVLEQLAHAGQVDPASPSAAIERYQPASAHPAANVSR